MSVVDSRPHKRPEEPRRTSTDAKTTIQFKSAAIAGCVAGNAQSDRGSANVGPDSIGAEPAVIAIA